MIREVIKTKPLLSFFSDEDNYVELVHVMAENGKILTNGEVITSEIFFSKNDPMEDWYEIDYEEEDFD